MGSRTPAWLVAVLVAGPAAALPVTPTSALGFVTLSGAVDLQALAAVGLDVIARFDAFPVVAARGDLHAWARAETVPGVVETESDRPLAYAMATAVRATRVAETRADGLAGAGVGIAIVDSGVDCTHPDLAARCVPGRNLRNVPGTDGFVPLPDTDLHHGHGTHVAGIALGDGAASSGRVEGVAPAARLYAYGLGAGPTLIGVLFAWDHMLAHRGAPGEPPILVAVHSFSGDGEPMAAESAAVRALARAGIVTVFAAGNAGDGGEDADRLNRLCKVADDDGAPLPGLICVGNYADGDVGSREGGVAAGSSRGPSVWLDVVAPGTAIEAPRAATAFVATAPTTATRYGDTALPHYLTLSGTSMAAPHAAGVVALLIEAARAHGRAHPTPGEIENALCATAYAPANYGPGRHVGCGLVDAQAAVGAVVGRPPPPAPPGLDLPTNVATPVLHSGTTLSADPGAPAQGANAVLALEGVPARSPRPYVLTPGATGIQVSLLVEDAGGTLLAMVAPEATVVAHVAFLGSGRVAVETLARDATVGAFTGRVLPYAPTDGDVRVEARFDLRGDGRDDPRTDISGSWLFRRLEPT